MFYRYQISECGSDAECDALYGDEKDVCNAQGECEGIVFT